MSIPAIVIASSSSGAGKTTLTLGIIAALKARGMAVRAAKCGPDYIDPAFHAVATGAPAINLDPWAMSPNDLRARAADIEGDILIIEAAMGVLDSASDGTGSAADLAEVLGVPVVMVLDVAKTGQSAALAPAASAADCARATSAASCSSCSFVALCAAQPAVSITTRATALPLIMVWNVLLITVNPLQSNNNIRQRPRTNSA